MFTQLEEINEDLKGLACLSFALAEQATTSSIDADALQFIAKAICEVQKRSEAVLDECRAKKS